MTSTAKLYQEKSEVTTWEASAQFKDSFIQPENDRYGKTLRIHLVLNVFTVSISFVLFLYLSAPIIRTKDKMLRVPSNQVIETQLLRFQVDY